MIHNSNCDEHYIVCLTLKENMSPWEGRKPIWPKQLQSRRMPKCRSTTRPLMKHLPHGSHDKNRHSSCLTVGIILSHVTQIPLDSVSMPCFPLSNIIFCLAIGNPCLSMETCSGSSSILAVAETRLPPLQACLSAHSVGKNLPAVLHSGKPIRIRIFAQPHSLQKAWLWRNLAAT